MKIEKAIEIQTDLTLPGCARIYSPQDAVDAQRLGIEALKWRLREEKRTPYLAYAPLPGETKD